MTKAIPFATAAWAQRFMAEINASESYRKAAQTWEGDFLFVVEPDGVFRESIRMYLDLHHGECRKAYILEDTAGLNPEFSISGSWQVWQAVTQKKLDPVKALLTRQLKLTGNIAKIMRNVKAANELVNCTTRFETDFPVG